MIKMGHGTELKSARNLMISLTMGNWYVRTFLNYSRKCVIEIEICDFGNFVLTFAIALGWNKKDGENVAKDKYLHSFSDTAYTPPWLRGDVRRHLL